MKKGEMGRNQSSEWKDANADWGNSYANWGNSYGDWKDANADWKDGDTKKWKDANSDWDKGNGDWSHNADWSNADWRWTNADGNKRWGKRPREEDAVPPRKGPAKYLRRAPADFQSRWRDMDVERPRIPRPPTQPSSQPAAQPSKPPGTQGFFAATFRFFGLSE